MAQYLSEQWCARYQELGAQLPKRDGLNVITQYVVEKTPDGNIRYYDVVTDGQITEVSLGKHKEATIKVTWRYDYAMKMLAGELGHDAAYMQGRIKVEDDYRTWLFELGELLRSPEYDQFRAALHADTEFQP